MATPDREIVVFERAAWWGPELRRQFPSAVIPIRECRRMTDVAVGDGRLSILVLVIDAAPAECLTWLALQSNRATIVALVSRELRPLEWALREAGVLAVVSDEISGQALAQWCRRCIRLMSETLNTPVPVVPDGADAKLLAESDAR